MKTQMSEIPYPGTDVVIPSNGTKRVFIFLDKLSVPHHDEDVEHLIIPVFDPLGSILEILMPTLEYAKENLGEDIKKFHPEIIYFADLVFYDVFFRLVRILTQIDVGEPIRPYLDEGHKKDLKFLKTLWNQCMKQSKTTMMI